MHKLMHKGLKKKKKTKKGKKGEEEDFDPEELERYRRQRAEAQEKAIAEGAGKIDQETAVATGSDEWQKFQALTAGVDSILKKTQGDLDRIKSTSFFQRTASVIKESKPDKDLKVEKDKTTRWIGFDKDGNPIEQASEDKKVSRKQDESDEWIFEIPDEDEDNELSAEEDIFDTTYIDVLQNTEIRLAYIPDSPTQEEFGDDPFDTTNADKVLKTIDKHGKKVVSLGNAVEVLSGRIDSVSTCKISRTKKTPNLDLWLGDDDIPAVTVIVEETQVLEEVKKTLLDEEVHDLHDIDIDLTKFQPIINVKSVGPSITENTGQTSKDAFDISEFEVLKEKRILEEIPDLDDDFDIDPTIHTSIRLEEAADPFGEKDSAQIFIEPEIIEVSFEAATFANEEDPFDTAFAEKLVPGKTELKVIERELEDLPKSEVSISLTDPAGLDRDYETGLLKPENESFIVINDLLDGSSTDLTQLIDQPIKPTEEITYVDPFDTSRIEEPAPGHAELKFLEKELLGDEKSQDDYINDDDFDPREEEIIVKSAPNQSECIYQNIMPAPVTLESEETATNIAIQTRKLSRPEDLGLASGKSVAFNLPTPSKRPDLLITSDEEKSIPSKPLTPYYSQKSLDEIVTEEKSDETNVDPFDTSFVSKVTPGKTELKLIESELLKEDTKLTHSISDQDFNLRTQINHTRRQSDSGSTRLVSTKNLQLCETNEAVSKHTKKSTDVNKINEEVGKKTPVIKRQESILDTEISVNVKTLTPTVENKILEEETTNISYTDPFDTSIASNIVLGKAELKLLESELSQIQTQLQSTHIPSIDLNISSTGTTSPLFLNNDDDFNPRAGEITESHDFLTLNGQGTGDKVLTPVTSKELLNDNIDPFDTSFASIGPGKVELKLLESELVDK